MAKWVYSFGDGKAEGSAAMKELLGGKGANLAEMASLGLPVPPGFTITTEVCTHFYANDRAYPPDLKAEVEAALGCDRRPDRPHLRRPERAAARVGPLRRARLDAGHDGHRPEPRPERRDGRRRSRRAADPRFAWDSYRRFIQMYGSVVLGVEHHEFEAILELEREKRGACRGHRHGRRRLAGDRRRSTRSSSRTRSKSRSRRRRSDQLWGAIGAVFGSWMNAARHRLPPAPRHPRELGHRRQRAGDGVRQHGRHVGHRRRLHAQSLDRREGALRRVPGQCAGRGRRRRHPHAAGSDRGGAHRLRLDASLARSADAGSLRRVPQHRRAARGALPRHAGRRVHHRARQALDAADALRQAHRQGGAEDRRRHGGARA